MLDQVTTKKIINALSRARALTDFTDILDRLAKDIGFNGYLYGTAPITVDLRNGDPFPNCITNFPTQWLYEYVGRGLSEFDVIAHQLYEKGDSPVFYDDIANPDRLEGEFRAARLVSYNAGIIDGIFIPLKQLAGVLSALTFYTSNDRPAKSILTDETIDHLTDIGIHLNDCLHRTGDLVKNYPFPEQLNTLEKNALQWMGHDGASYKEIAERSNRSVKTVEKIASNAYRKLGASSQAQAVAIAIKWNII
ncbi:MAG: autoinducer binding domain-containing protein [Gammaproteobacteria bacterium]|nr:autoinducer binding domain-containing protein [Gammaproteobacteria bacterium]